MSVINDIQTPREVQLLSLSADRTPACSLRKESNIAFRWDAITSTAETMHIDAHETQGHRELIISRFLFLASCMCCVRICIPRQHHSQLEPRREPPSSLDPTAHRPTRIVNRGQKRMRQRAPSPDLCVVRAGRGRAGRWETGRRGSATADCTRGWML